MSIELQGDVRLYHTTDGGDIDVENGVIDMSNGLETAVYLSLFGGNEDDDGRKENNASWWGNIDETEHKQYRSETQNLLQSLPATTGNLRRIEDAVKRDLKWLTTDKITSSVDAEVTIPHVNTIKIKIYVKGVILEYIENWKVIR